MGPRSSVDRALPSGGRCRRFESCRGRPHLRCTNPPPPAETPVGAGSFGIRPSPAVSGQCPATVTYGGTSSRAICPEGRWYLLQHGCLATVQEQRGVALVQHGHGVPGLLQCEGICGRHACRPAEDRRCHPGGQILQFVLSDSCVRRVWATPRPCANSCSTWSSCQEGVQGVRSSGARLSNAALTFAETRQATRSDPQKDCVLVARHGDWVEIRDDKNAWHAAQVLSR